MTPQAAQQHLDEGIVHYKNGHFELAESSLRLGLSGDGNSWQHRFYLAMTYTRLEKTREAKSEFMTIRDLCPDKDLRQKAEYAIIAINAPSGQHSKVSSHCPRPQRADA